MTNSTAFAATLGAQAVGTVPAPDELRRLVGRVTFGVNIEELERATALGYEGYLEHHLNYLDIDDYGLNGRLQPFKTLDGSLKENRMMMEQGDDEQPAVDFFGATFVRSAYSKRQLYERMVEFWGDHFNIFFGSDSQELLKPVHDRDVIRKHAMGRFPDLLAANAHSAAMLHYLDNTSNHVSAPNQNYARELVELHTLGPGHYTQRDIEELARCFTGWTVVEDDNDPRFGAFRFDPFVHDYGAKTVLGVDIPSGGGVEDGERVLEILSTREEVAPFTAKLLAGKLAQRFWGDDPPPALIEEIAGAYTASGGDIKSMLRVVLSRNWLKQAPPKLKRPYDLLISALRTMPSSIRNPRGVAELLEVMGQAPFHWRAPDGYPDDAEYWGGFALVRWSFGAWFAGDDDLIHVNWRAFANPSSMSDFFATLDNHFFGGALPAEERRILTSFLSTGWKNANLRREAIGIAIGSPAFQWH